jgi:hypothetical protein
VYASMCVRACDLIQINRWKELWGARKRMGRERRGSILAIRTLPPKQQSYMLHLRLGSGSQLNSSMPDSFAIQWKSQ